MLRPGAESLNIIDVIEITEGRPLEIRCILGHDCDTNTTPCPLHPQWEAIKNREIGFLRGQTVGAISRAMFWVDGGDSCRAVLGPDGCAGFRSLAARFSVT
jgi:hypothetical protein